MKNICKLLLSIMLISGCAWAEELQISPISEQPDITIGTEHPIDLQEKACRSAAQNTEQTINCLANSIKYWSYETSKYYSLLHKKLKDENKTAIYDSQKYWNLYKNNDFKVIDAIYDKEYETPERVITQVEQKKDVIKNRAQFLHSYYVQSFPETVNPDEKIPVNSVYKPDNFVIRALRHIGF